jgi:MFS family permease
VTAELGRAASGGPGPAAGSVAPANRPPAYDQRRFLAVVVIAGVGLGMTAPLTVLYAAGFGASDALAGLAVSSVAVSLLAVDVFGTQLVPRIDGRRVVWLAMTIFGVGSFASAAAPTLGYMVAARMLQGVGAALFMGGALQVVVRFAAPSRAGQAIGAFNAAWFSGVAIGPFLGGTVAAQVTGQDGYRLAFALCGVVCLVVAVWARVALPPIPSDAPPRLSLPRAARARPGFRLRGPLALAAFGQAVRGGLVFTIIPLMGERDLGLDTATVGLALSVLAAVDVVAMRVGGTWADRIGRRPVLVGALVVGAAACALAPLVDGPARFATWCAVVAVAVGVTWVVPTAVVVDVAEVREAALSNYRISADVGQLGGSTGAGALVGAWGSVGALWVVAAAFGGVAAWVARLPEAAAGPGREAGRHRPTADQRP